MSAPATPEPSEKRPKSAPATPEPPEKRPKSAPATPEPPEKRPKVVSQLATLALLVALALALLTSIPGLRDVVRQIAHISPIWLGLAILLELASNVSFVVLFRRFFDRLSGRDGRALAWTEQATGALLPGGGAGGLAIGGWLIHLTDAPTDWIVRRSGGDCSS